MRTRSLFLTLILVLACGAAFGNIAIDEDFEAGTFFADQQSVPYTTSTVSTNQGVNVLIDPASKDANYNGTGDPIVFSNVSSAGGLHTIDSTHHCYILNAGQTLQFGTMNGTTYVNGKIPYWGDSNGVVQSALAAPAAATSLSDGAVVGKMEIAYDGLSLTNPANMRTQTYELRVDAANTEVDVYAIDNDDAATKILDGLDGTNWANITSVWFLRGLNTTVTAAQWGNIIGGQKGPAAQTVMATNAAGDSARLSVFVNSDTPTAAAQYGWTASNGDGRLALDGKNDGRVMGIKYTAGASTPLFIDNIFVASEGFHYVATSDPVNTNKHGRLNAFTEITQGVPVELTVFTIE